MIKFINYRTIYFAISGSLLLISLISLIVWGLRPSIDFVGGAIYEIRVRDQTQEIGSETIEQYASEVPDLSVYTIQYSQETSSYILRTNSINEAKKAELKAKLEEKIGSNLEELRFESVGAVLGKELLIKTGIAVLIASLLIMGYVAYQFKDKKYGIAAILAVIHDTVILLGFFAIFGKFLGVEVDTLFVTAVLTTLSFSVHDTIVVFDRIRENLRKNTGQSLENIIDTSILTTLPRSLNNSLTIIFMLTCLFLFGGITIKWFVVALLIGTILGTYSSPFVASPLLYVLSVFKRKTKL